MITLLELKTFLGVSGTEDDEKLSQIISASESIFSSFCGDISERTVVEKYCGDGSKTLFLAQKNPSFPNYGTDSFIKFGRTEQELQEISEFEIESGILIFVEGFFPEGIKNIEIKYKCGYAETPEDVKQALFSLCDMIFTGAGKESYASESIGDYSVSYAGKGKSYPPIFTSVIGKYR